MPSAAVHTLAVQELVDRHQASSTDRLVDLQLTVIHDGEALLTVGGVWDQVQRRYLDPTAEHGHARTERVIEIHAGQRQAFEWWCDWLRRYMTTEAMQHHYSTVSDEEQRAALARVARLARHDGHARSENAVGARVHVPASAVA